MEAGATAGGGKKPLVTANMVTTARLVGMPVLPWLAYAGSPAEPNAWYWLLIVGFVIGSTDYLDGYLARKHGPTVLGGLLDPIADKVSIAAFYLPLAVLGIIPAWATALLFVREFLVTGLRSAFALRGLVMKTSYLAKVKTWMQMQGIGLILMLVLFDRPVMTTLLGIAVGIPLLLTVAVTAKRRRFFLSGAVMTGLVAILLVLYLFFSVQIAIEVAVYIMVLITWASGADYLVVGLPKLRSAGDFSRADAVRLIGAIALPCTVMWAITSTEHGWLPIIIISIELAVGGLDNLLSHHRVASGAAGWALRTLGVSALCAGAALAPGLGHDGLTAPALYAALALATIGSAVEFWRGRRYYLDEKFRDTQA